MGYMKGCPMECLYEYAAMVGILAINRTTVSWICWSLSGSW